MSGTPRLPASLIAASIVMFIYGALLLICVMCSGGALAMQPPDHFGLQAELDKEAPGHKIVQFAAVGMNMIFGIAFIGAGVGLLWMSQIARYGTYALCLLILLITCMSTGYQAFVVSPVTERFLEKHMALPQNQGGPPPDFMKNVMIGSRALGVVIAIGIPIIFVIPIVILVSVQSARDACAGRFPEDPLDERRRRGVDDYDDEDDFRRPSKSPGTSDETGITDREPY